METFGEIRNIIFGLSQIYDTILYNLVQSVDGGKMLHKMKLQEDPFERIKNGTKTVEFRLYDEKRQTIQIGDEIEFSKLPELQEKLLVKVIDLYKEKSFEKLFKKVFVGEDEEKIIEKYKNETNKLKATIIKIAHHGSKTSSIEKILSSKQNIS